MSLCLLRLDTYYYTSDQTRRRHPHPECGSLIRRGIAHLIDSFVRPLSLLAHTRLNGQALLFCGSSRQWIHLLRITSSPSPFSLAMCVCVCVPIKKRIPSHDVCVCVRRGGVGGRQKEEGEAATIPPGTAPGELWSLMPHTLS